MINILLIDVDETLQHLCKKYLERSSDLHVEAVNSVKEAEKRLSQKKIDAIVSDLYLPWMSGLEYLKKIRLRRDRIPFILFTGRVEEDIVIDALNSGVNYFMLKGTNPSAKLGDLEHMIRQSVHDRWKEQATGLKMVAFDRALVANVMIDAQDRVLELNDAAMKLWKIKERADVVGKDVKDMLEYRDVIEVVKTSIDILGRWEGDFTSRRGDGTNFTAYAYVTNVLDDAGKLSGYHITLTDITDKKTCEDALRKSEENLRLIAENSTDWIALLGPSGSIFYSSSSVKEMTGFTPDESIAMGLDRMVHGEDLTHVKEEVRRMLDSGSVPPIEYRLMKKGGGSVRVETLGRVFDAGKDLGVRVLLMTRDISCRAIPEAPVTAEPTPAVQTVVNDINVVTRSEDLDRLMDVKGYLELVKERAKDPWLLDRYALMDTLLDTVIENATSVMEFQQIGLKEAEWQSVHDLLRDVVMRIDPEEVHVQVLAKRLEVQADPMLDRVFHGLIDNTMKHGGKAHKIWITYEVEGDSVKIIYEDNGVGIEESMKPALFERRSGRHGLPFASAVLKATDITIVENGVPGKGVRFEILVPKGRFRLR